MKRISSISDIGVSKSSSSKYGERSLHGREIEEKERRRREWMIRQEKEREHERLKKKKIEEYERKRRAREQENELKNHRRSSYRSNDRRKTESPELRKKDEIQQPSTSRNSVMSEKYESSSNNARLFKGPDGTKIDLTELRRIKVDIHRKINNAEISNELQRDIIDPEDVKVKRRHGEGSKPIFEREELKKPEVPGPEVEEHRTVVALDDDKIENKQSTSKKRSATPTSPIKRPTSRRHIDDHDTRYESSKHNFDKSTTHRSRRQESDKDRSRSKDREYRSSRRSSHRDISRDHKDRRNRSHSGDRRSARSDYHNRSSSDRLSHRERDERLSHRERDDRLSNRERDDSRERRHRDGRSRERRIAIPHPYAEAMPVPMYYETFRPRPMMIAPMMPIRGQMPMGAGRMPPMMRPMRPPYPPRFLPHEMFRPSLHLNPRFSRMF